jgi:hypothetical protein
MEGFSVKSAELINYTVDDSYLVNTFSIKICSQKYPW